VWLLTPESSSFCLLRKLTVLVSRIRPRNSLVDDKAITYRPTFNTLAGLSSLSLLQPCSYSFETKGRRTARTRTATRPFVIITIIMQGVHRRSRRSRPLPVHVSETIAGGSWHQARVTRSATGCETFQKERGRLWTTGYDDRRSQCNREVSAVQTPRLDGRG
jgi:hypothetical protein